ncbi:MAG TPA: hypothetical protein VGK93_08380 [Candidatus Eisenbacteria bacterium]|jgi:hypothetical protein
MTWWARFLGWASALTAASLLFGEGYRWALAQAAMALIALGGQQVVLQKIEVLAPSDLALFGALCLASRRARWRVRFKALAIGIPSLVAMDVLSVVLGVSFLMYQGAHGPAAPGIARWVDGVMAMLPWMSACVLWLLLLGFRELPVQRRGGEPRGSPAGA